MDGTASFYLSNTVYGSHSFWHYLVILGRFMDQVWAGIHALKTMTWHLVLVLPKEKYRHIDLVERRAYCKYLQQTSEVWIRRQWLNTLAWVYISKMLDGSSDGGCVAKYSKLKSGNETTDTVAKRMGKSLFWLIQQTGEKGGSGDPNASKHNTVS
ncbi:hypothetical protein BC941DRAFT_465411 [Chlamydoabsidia padenii]|nr:hypothetical protein BC941DRAFT_465411 [Chlamydoabsidia padenii]